MKDNKLTISIHKPIAEVYLFTITPPNSIRWIPGIVSEVTNEWPVKKGTVYTLQTKNGVYSDVIVSNIKKNQLVEWVSKDGTYHCRYSFKSLQQNVTELTYFEWVDTGQLTGPFTVETLQALKSVLNNR